MKSHEIPGSGVENTQPQKIESEGALENRNQQLMDDIEQTVVENLGSNTEMVVSLFDELNLDNKIKVAEFVKERLQTDTRFDSWAEAQKNYDSDGSIRKMLKTVLSVLETEKGLPESKQKSAKKRAPEGDTAGVKRGKGKGKKEAEVVHVPVIETEPEENIETATPTPTPMVENTAVAPAEKGPFELALENAGKLKTSAEKATGKPKTKRDTAKKTKAEKATEGTSVDVPESVIEEPLKTKNEKPEATLEELEKEFAPAFEAAKEKPVAKNPEKKEVEYKPFSTLEDVEKTVDKIIDDKETDKFVLNNTYDAADVLFKKIVDSLYDEAETEGFVADDSFKDKIQSETKKLEQLNKFLVNKPKSLGKQEHSIRNFILDTYDNCVSYSSALIRLYNKVNKKEAPVVKKPTAEKTEGPKKPSVEKIEAKDAVDPKKTQAEIDEFVELIKDKTAPVAHEIESLTNVFRSEKKENITSSQLVIGKENLDLMFDSLNIKTDKKTYGAIFNYFKKYALKEILKLKESLLHKYSNGAEFDIDILSKNTGRLSDNKNIIEAINKSSVDAVVVEEIKKIMQKIDSLLSYAERKKLELTLSDEFENEIEKGDKQVERDAELAKAREKKKVETPPEPITPPTPEPTPEPVEPPTPTQTVKKLSDILAPRSMDEPLDESISGDVEFNKFMTDILETSIKLSVGVAPESDRDSIEDLYKVYTETKPTIDKLKAAMESGQMDNLFKDYWYAHNKVESTGEEIEMAKKLYFQELQYTAFYSRHNPEEMKAIQTIIESAEKAKKHETTINDLEQEITKLQSVLKPEGEEIDAKTVYESIGANPTEATQERLRELHDFAEDLHLNYAFYGGLKEPINAEKMYRLYKATHKETVHRTERIPAQTKVWTKIKNAFSKENIDADELKKFTDKINIFTSQRLIPVNKRDSLGNADLNFRKFNEFMEMAIQGLKDDKDILDPKFVGEMKQNGSTEFVGEGKEIFMKVYESYTNLRALDADMQARARRNNSHIADRIRTASTSLEHAKNEKQAESSHALKTNPEHLEILKQAKISIALNKIKEVRVGLQNFKKKDSTTPKPKKGGMMPSVNSTKIAADNAASIDRIIEDYNYASNIFENTDPEDITPEDAMLFKTTRLMFLEKVLQSDESMTKRLQEVLKKNFSTYNGVAESDMLKEEKTKFFDSIITELNAKITPKTQPLEKHQLESIIKQFEAIKSSIK